jgi:outer membrane protein assembly factor BamB
MTVFFDEENVQSTLLKHHIQGERSTMRQAWFFFLLFFLPSLAPAQTAGEILWSVDLAYTASISLPVVGPDGTIYVHAGQFYAISPDGEIRWSKPLGVPKATSVGSDGTVYAGSAPGDDDIYAYDPDGNLLWQFAEPDGGQGLMAGPTVGPDGNIYAISDAGGLGAFSLTPEGGLRWNVPGFANNAGTGQTPVPLGLDRLYFAEWIVPGCEVTRMASVDFDGNLDWCAELSGVDLGRPLCPPNGNAYITSGNVMYAFGPEGNVLWSHSFPVPGGGFIGPGTGPDNSAFVFHTYVDLWAFNEDGSVRWTAQSIAAGNFPIIPTVASDNEALVFGTVYSFGRNGSVFALDPSNGQVLWNIPVTSPSSGAGGPAAFSADGNVVYVPISSVSSSIPSKLIAIQVHDASTGAAPVVSDIPDQSIALGGRFAPIRLDKYVADPDHGDNEISWTFSGNTSLVVRYDPARRVMNVRPRRNWTGTETITFTATDPDGLSDSDQASFTVTASASISNGNAIDLESSGLTPDAPVLLGNHPNPFNPTTTIRFGLSSDEHVSLVIYDLLGRTVATVVDGWMEAGYHGVTYDARDLATGVYIYRLTAGDFSETRRLVLMK